MRVWLVLLLLAVVALVMVSAERGRRPGARRGQGGRRPGRGGVGRPGRGNGGEEVGEDGEDETEGGEVGENTRGRGGRGNGKKGGRWVRPTGSWQKKKKRRRGPGLFHGSIALKKCSWCILKCKKTGKTFGECLNTTETSPCYGMCATASDNMMDCLTCIGECSGVVDEETGKKSNAWTCTKKPNAPCKERCAAPAPAEKEKTTAEPEVEEGDNADEDAPAPSPQPAWYRRWFF